MTYNWRWIKLINNPKVLNCLIKPFGDLWTTLYMNTHRAHDSPSKPDLKPPRLSMKTTSGDFPSIQLISWSGVCTSCHVKQSCWAALAIASVRLSSFVKQNTTWTQRQQQHKQQLREENLRPLIALWLILAL